MARLRKKVSPKSPTLQVLVVLLTIVLVLSISSLALASPTSGTDGVARVKIGGDCGYPSSTLRTILRTTTTVATTTTTAPTTSVTIPTTVPTTPTTQAPSTVTAIETGGGGTAGPGAGQWALAALAGALCVGLVTSAVRVRQKSKS